jgi:cell division cycle 14
LYYAALPKLPPSHNILASIPKRKQKGDSSSLATSATAVEKGPKKQIHFFCIDNELVYWNFFLDFGPLNTGQLVRFSKKLNDKLRKFPAVCFYSNTVPAKRANAIFLICAWQMLYLDRTPEQAYAGFITSHNAEYFHHQQTAVTATERSLPPISQSQGAPTIAELPPFHDASPCQCTFELTVFDCLKGLQKARMHNFFNKETFDVEEYEYFEQVEVRAIEEISDGYISSAAGNELTNLQILLLLRSARIFFRDEK